MKIHEYKPNTKLDGERVIALGFFDGVHIGHRRLIEKAISEAARKNAISSVFTFPAESGMPKNGTGRLYTTPEKLTIFENMGVDEVILADFASVKDLSPESFVSDTLIGDLGCRIAISGRDFRFGSGAMGDSLLLEKIMNSDGREVCTEEDVTLHSRKVSTTAIKEYLTRGMIDEANEMLGAEYFIISEVGRGRGVGHTLGYPTLNTELYGKAEFLRPGVYCSSVEVGERRLPALTNVGSCPTFEPRPPHAESFILDFGEELYGSRVKIFLHSYIREERRFDSPEALTAQIKTDVEKAKEFFKHGRKLD